MVAGMAKTWRRHTVFIIKDTLICLYAFVGFIAIAYQPHGHGLLKLTDSLFHWEDGSAPDVEQG